MIGTTPAFFKIPVTEQLVSHVRHGTYPSQPTRVTYCYPPLARRYSEGMKPLDNRRSILSCYEAFKAIVGIVGWFYNWCLVWAFSSLFRICPKHPRCISTANWRPSYRNSTTLACVFACSHLRDTYDWIHAQFASEQVSLYIAVLEAYFEFRSAATVRFTNTP